MSAEPVSDTPPITAAVFDFGDVLVRWDVYAALEPTYTRAQIDQFIEATDFYGFNYLQDAGRPWDEALEWFRDHHPQWVGYVETYLGNVRGSVVAEVPGTADIVRELQAGGITCAGLTNWSREYVHLAAEVAPVIAQLDQTVVSGVERIAKPDPRIYELTTQRLGRAPGEIVFIDDQERNVAGARAHGWRAVLFTGAAALRSELHALGLPVRETAGSTSTAGTVVR